MRTAALPRERRSVGAARSYPARGDRTTTWDLPWFLPGDLWYGSTVRLLLIAALAVASVACGASPIENLPLKWQGVDAAPRPSPAVAQALATTPVAFGLRDVRPDPTVVGLHEDGNHVVRTTDNVAQFASSKMGEMLRAAGARLDEAPVAVVESDLTEYKVTEGGRFNGIAAIRITVRRGGAPDWSRTFQGSSHRWGKSFSPDNFNEALSNALHDATEQLLRDDGFAFALMGSTGQPQQPPAPPAAAADSPTGY